MKEDAHSNNIRIVIKKKRHAAVHHGGAWKVAYADFVTAMMALFIVLWIVGASSQVKGAVSLYFSNPDFFKGGAGILKDSTKSSAIPDMMPKPITVQSDLIKSEVSKLKEEGKKIEGIISSEPNLTKFKDKIKISVTNEGMKIELIENAEGLFFNVGSAKLKEETITILKLIAGEIGKLPNKIIIEGHTDSRPYDTPGYSNWELSADRANATRKILEENGLQSNQIAEVRGFADKFLKHPDKPLDYSNRRVNILLEIPKKTEQTAIASTSSSSSS
jgi:chemotaxis protein MotB